MKAKNELIKKATELSKRGLSVRQIAKELNCSKSFVSRWLMDQENNEEDEDCLCPHSATDKAMVDLIKALQTSSYHMNDNFNRTASHILLELMSNLVIKFNEDGSYATEKDLVCFDCPGFIKMVPFTTTFTMKWMSCAIFMRTCGFIHIKNSVKQLLFLELPPSTVVPLSQWAQWDNCPLSRGTIFLCRPEMTETQPNM